MLPVEALKPHERVEEDRAGDLAKTIASDGYIEEPIVVDRRHHVILDGHHRFEALRRLDCRRVPVYQVDYDLPTVRVTLWDGAEADDVTKTEVVRRGLEADPFPPKTTRHLFDEDLPIRRVPLVELR